jgi:hypothetical protein
MEREIHGVGRGPWVYIGGLGRLLSYDRGQFLKRRGRAQRQISAF